MKLPGSWLARLYLYYICFCLSSVAKTTRIVCPILHPLYRMTLRAHDHGAHVALEVCRASDRAFSPQPLHTKETFDQRHCTPRAIYKRLRQESFRQSAATRAATPWAFSHPRGFRQKTLCQARLWIAKQDYADQSRPGLQSRTGPRKQAAVSCNTQTGATPIHENTM